MPDYCCVPRCENQGRPFSYHRFPRNKQLLKTWLHVIRRKNLQKTTRDIKVCSQHFKPEDFRSTLLGARAILKETAVPSIFPWLVVSKTNRGERKHRSMEPLAASGTPSDSEPEQDIVPVPDADHEEIVQPDIDDTTVTTFSTDANAQTYFVGNLDINNVLNNPDSVLLYTGFVDSEHFNLVFATLGENRYELQVLPLEPELCFLLTVLKLRTNKTDLELGLNFGIHKSTVGKIFSVWINFMYCQFKELNIWPDRKTVFDNSPPAFRDKYPTTRVIIDATEVSIMKPRNPTAQQATFSAYKNSNTAKVLIGINPSGFICFISDAYGGAVSDRQLFIRSGMLELLP